MGNVIAFGNLTGTVNLGGGNLTTVGAYDMYLAKFTSGGVHSWSTRFGGTSNQYAEDVAIDSGDNILVTGFNQDGGSVSFGGNILGPGALLAKLTSTGAHSWSTSFTSTNASGLGLSVLPDDGVVLGGYFKSQIDLGGNVLAAVGGQDGFVARFDAFGMPTWWFGYGDGSNQEIRSVASVGSEVALVGSYLGAVSFGGPSLSNGGAKDGFVARLAR